MELCLSIFARWFNSTNLVISWHWLLLYMILFRRSKKGISYKNTYTGWKVSVFGVLLVRIFPYSDWIRRSLRIQSECGKMRTRITANTDTFHAVSFSLIGSNLKLLLSIRLWMKSLKRLFPIVAAFTKSF